MIAQIGRLNLIAVSVALACFVVWVWQSRPQQMNTPQYNFSLALRPPLPPDARAGTQKSGHSETGAEDQFQGEVISPDGDDQSKSNKDDDSDDDEMNPEDKVYPI